MQNMLPPDISVPAQAPMMPGQMTYYDAVDVHDVDLRTYWHVLWKRKWWFFGVLALVVGVTLAKTLLMTPIYKVTTTLQIIQDNPSAVTGSKDPLASLTGGGEVERFYQTQYSILKSTAMAYGLIDALDLKEHPSYKKLEEASKDDPPELIRQKYAQSLLKNLTVEPVRNSFLVNVSFMSSDKSLARQVPETIQKVYLDLSMNTRQQSYTTLREWLDGELTRLGKRLEISERNVYTDGQKNDALSLEEPGANVTIQKYVDVSKLLTQAQADKAGKEAQYRQIQEKGMDAPLITNNGLIQQLRQQLIAAESEVTGRSKIYGSNYPEYQAQAAKLNDLRSRLGEEINRQVATVRSDYEAASRAESLIQKEFDLQRSKLADLQNDMVHHHILTRDLQTNQTLYEGLLARMKEASIASTMVASNVSVITAAETPVTPEKPKPKLYMLLALVVGVMGGMGAAFFVEYMDSSIKTTEELETICRIPTLGVVPLADAKELENGSLPLELVSFNNPKSMVSESIFHIRTAIMLSASMAPPQVITVTSANPAEGKSTFSANLAAVLAGSDRKCLLMDCDLRKPRLHRVFEYTNRRGLTNHLTGNATLEDVIKSTKVPNLFFIPAGPTPPNPNELFASTAFKDLIHHLRQEYHHIIIDSPPIIGFADARSISSYADGAVLVVRHHETTREAGRLAMQLLSQGSCRILGGILSMAQKDRLGYYDGYYGYYRYYSKYYKEYNDNGSKGKEGPEA